MDRDIYDEDHEAFRDVVKEYIKRYVTNEAIEQWDAEGEIDRATMLAAGDAGIIGLSVPEEFGGAGMLQDFRFRAVVNEEIIGAGAGSLAGAFGIQDDLAVPYIVHMGTQEQKEKWLPGMATGEIIGALAMTEPGAGSDLRGDQDDGKEGRGRLPRQRREDVHLERQDRRCPCHVREDRRGQPADAFSLLLLENGMDGFDHGKKLHKMGFHGHDTAELSFSDVFVPEENLISGKEGMGFVQLMMNLPLERLSIGVAGAAAAEAGLSGRSNTPRAARPSASGSSTSRTPDSSWRMSRPPSTCCGRTSTARCSPTRTGSSRPKRPRRSSSGRPSASGRCSTSASSCTAGTATSWNTPSPARSSTPASTASTAARTRSCARSSAGRSPGKR